MIDPCDRFLLLGALARYGQMHQHATVNRAEAVTVLNAVRDAEEALERERAMRRRLTEALNELEGQVVQARDGFGIYHSCSSMETALRESEAAVKAARELDERPDEANTSLTQTDPV